MFLRSGFNRKNVILALYHVSNVKAEMDMRVGQR